MLKINVGISRKLTQDFQSRGFSLNIEGELPSDVLHNSETLAGTTRDLFNLAHRMLNEQINDRSSVPAENGIRGQLPAASSPRPPSRNDSRKAANGQSQSVPSHGPSLTPGNSERSSTQAQGRAIVSMSQKLGRDHLRWVHDEFGVNSLQKLTIRQASEAIDGLKRLLGQVTQAAN